MQHLFHAKVCYDSYSFGLGCNTMKGREQKHQAISKYANNTTYQNRWQQIFRHEYIHLIHLRENGFDKLRYNKKHAPYIPQVEIDQHCRDCCLALLSGSCELCSSDIMKRVLEVISSN